jgi:hypothetical protein
MYSLFVWFQEFNLRISDSAAVAAPPPPHRRRRAIMMGLSRENLPSDLVKILSAN